MSVKGDDPFVDDNPDRNHATTKDGYRSLGDLSSSATCRMAVQPRTRLFQFMVIKDSTWDWMNLVDGLHTIVRFALGVGVIPISTGFSILGLIFRSDGERVAMLHMHRRRNRLYSSNLQEPSARRT